MGEQGGGGAVSTPVTKLIRINCRSASVSVSGNFRLINSENSSFGGQVPSDSK